MSTLMCALPRFERYHRGDFIRAGDAERFLAHYPYAVVEVTEADEEAIDEAAAEGRIAAVVESIVARGTVQDVRDAEQPQPEPSPVARAPKRKQPEAPKASAKVKPRMEPVPDVDAASGATEAPTESDES